MPNRAQRNRPTPAKIWQYYRLPDGPPNLFHPFTQARPGLGTLNTQSVVLREATDRCKIPAPQSTVWPERRLKPNTTGRYMPSVKLKENEPFDVALRRFKRSCEKAGVLAEVRRREFYEKPTAVRKRKAAAAVKRHAKKLMRENRKFQRMY